MDDSLPDLTLRGYDRMIDHGGVQSVHYPDGTIRVRHTCTRPRDGVTLIVAPELTIPGHTVISLDPVTISPSILCDDCGLHGFIREGRWVPA